MRVLFIEPKVNNPVRITNAPPMSFIALYSFAISRLENFEFFFYSLEIDNSLGVKSSVDSIFNKYNPDIIISSSLTCNFNSVKKILKLAKEKNCITILGGIFPTANDLWILQNFPFIDIVIRGEGENTFIDVLKRINSKLSLQDVLGISFRNNGNFIQNPERPLINLRKLPVWSYDKIPISLYKNLETRFYVFASRGCIHNCTFCTLAQHWQGRCRVFSINRVIKEIDHLINLFSPKQISFGDDTLTLNKDYFVTLCEELARIKFPVKFGGKTRIDMIDLKSLELMHKAGFAEISFGVESNDEYQLEILGKGSIYSVQSNLKNIIQKASDFGFRVNLNFILGAPGETVDSLKKKAVFIIKHYLSPNVIPLLGFLTPHPGTKLYNSINNLKIGIINQNLDHYNHLQPVCLPESLGFDGLTMLKKTFNFISKETCSEKYNPLLEV